MNVKLKSAALLALMQQLMAPDYSLVRHCYRATDRTEKCSREVTWHTTPQCITG